jgi:hypothetical protein
MKKKNEEELAKLVKLTKMLKKENVKVSPKGSPIPRAPNKWRQQDPKFASPEPKPANPNLVEAGGMKVDPSLKDAYEQWREDKIREQNERREMAERRLKAKRAAYLEEATRRAKDEQQNI